MGQRSERSRHFSRQDLCSIEKEWLKTVSALEAITGEAHRLADNPSLARSIARRFAYTAPLNYLQVELLRRWRAGQNR